MTISSISAISNKSFNDKDSNEKKIITGGGATAAAVTASRAKNVRSGFDMFASSKQVSQGMKAVTQTAKTVNTTVKQTTSLWSKVCKNAKWAKEAVLEWGSKFNNMKYIKPLVNNKVFKFGAGALGYGFGLVTLISGLSDIAQVATDTAEGHLFNKAA